MGSSNHSSHTPQDEVTAVQSAAPLDAAAGGSVAVDRLSHPSSCHSDLEAPAATPRTPSTKTPTGPKTRTPKKQKIRADTKSPPATTIYSTVPQSSVQLQNEQAYLLATLPTQACRASGYMRRLSELQDRFKAGEVPSDQRRKTRKQISMLKKKIDDASEQQKVILGRLGELFVELQNRQQWTQLMGGPMSAVSAWQFHPESPMTPWTDCTPNDMTPMASTPLDASTQEFVPMGYFAFTPVEAQPCVPVTWNAQDLEMGNSFTPNASFSSSEPWGDEDTTASQPSRSDYDGVDPLTREDEDMLEDGSESRSPCDQRRQSVPCMKTVWPGHEDQEPKNEAELRQGCHEQEGHGCEGEDVQINLDHRLRQGGV